MGGGYTEGLEKSLEDWHLAPSLALKIKIEDEGVDSLFWKILPVRDSTNAECLLTESRVTRLLVYLNAVPRRRHGKGNMVPLIVIPC